MYYEWKPYVSVAQRRKNAEREMAKLGKKGQSSAPITLQGRAIANTFWGKAWCDNLEAYSDYANRLPRGRSYVRNGSVLDLRVEGSEIQALVSGSSLYRVTVKVAPIARASWQAICTGCAGSIDSLVELLQGRLSKAVMERVCQRSTGLFPAPAEIKLSCSCPDSASMCKHVAAVLYGIGARLDEQPALIFKLRAVNEAEMIASAAGGQTLGAKGPAKAKVLDDDLSELFGLDMEQFASPESAAIGTPAAAAPPRKAAAPGMTKLAPVKKAAAPSMSKGTPARKAAPGKAKVAPARKAEAGKTNVAPVKKTAAPGRARVAPVKKAAAPGRAKVAPVKKTAPGRARVAPVKKAAL